MGLGSNVGDRRAHLKAGLAGIRTFAQIRAVSSLYESEPVGPGFDYGAGSGAGSGPRGSQSFLNAVADCRGPLSPEATLERLLVVEESRGRTREGRGGPRTLDLDLLFFESRIVRSATLRVPHPRWRERAFVCEPLVEVVPHLVDPESGWTVEEWCRAERPNGHVARIAPPQWVDP